MNIKRLVSIFLLMELILIMLINSCSIIDPVYETSYNRIIDAQWINRDEVIVVLTKESGLVEFTFAPIMKINWRDRSAIVLSGVNIEDFQRMIICNNDIYFSTYDCLVKLDTIDYKFHEVENLSGNYINISPDSSYIAYRSWTRDTSFVIIETATNEIHTCISEGWPPHLFDFDWDNKRVYWFGNSAKSYYDFENDTIIPCNISGYKNYDIYGGVQCHSIVYDDSIQLWRGEYEEDQIITIYAPYTDTSNYTVSPCDRWYSNEDGDYIYPFISNNTIEFYSKSGRLIDTLKLKL